ncbi:MAG: nitroreductase family protein, partial [Bacteroidales bacterium]|nr:nitroreductase family protein [Bacteroidales bacterium]
AKNQQVLRFKMLTGKQAAEFCPFIKLGALLPDMKFPPEGCEPSAFIIVCSTIPENKWVDMDLGISAQSMLLKATEMGLYGICIGAFNKEKAKSLVPDGLDPVLAIALGKGAEKYQILHIAEDENHNYFRENGIHYIPKVRIEDLIIK